MNRIIILLLGLMASLVIALPASASDRDRGNDRYRNFDGYHGYRERPYDRGRHYGHYKRKTHRYEDRGHWRSWNEFDRYIERHPDVRRHGRYYRDGAHLMFRTCDPDGSACFFFSIGR